MIDLEDIKAYLPKYLSTDSQKDLFKQLKDFPENIDKRLFTLKLAEQKVIFQGDGINDLLMINLPDERIRRAKGMVISNTCDIDLYNERMFPSNICYAPIFSLRKYKKIIESEGIYTADKLNDHISSIKKQRVSQIFYLPEIHENLSESIVFLDRIISCNNETIEREGITERRVFTLSDYGLYLFLFKLSVHFTRIQERVERGAA